MNWFLVALFMFCSFSFFWVVRDREYLSRHITRSSILLAVLLTGMLVSILESIALIMK